MLGLQGEPLSLPVPQEQQRGQPEGPVIVAGSLQRQWRDWEELGVNAQVLRWVKEGVDIKVDSSKVYQDTRTFPMTAEQMEWTEEELTRMLQAHEIMEIPRDRVEHLSPIFCVPKSGPKKWRLVIDMRGLNQGMEDMPVKFETLDTLARLAGRGFWMLTFDLMRGYHHVKMQWPTARKLGFQFKGKHYVFLVLPFGVKLAPAIFTKIVREMVKV